MGMFVITVCNYVSNEVWRSSIHTAGDAFLGSPQDCVIVVGVSGDIWLRTVSVFIKRRTCAVKRVRQHIVIIRIHFHNITPCAFGK